MSAPTPPERIRTCLLILQQNRWLAARYGLDAMLIDPCTHHKTPARVLARELIDHLIPSAGNSAAPNICKTSGPELVRSNGAATQLATYARTNNLEDVVRLMTRADSSGTRPPSLAPLFSPKTSRSIPSRPVLEDLQFRCWLVIPQPWRASMSAWLFDNDRRGYTGVYCE